MEQLGFDVSATKRCSSCGEIKPLTEFHRRRAAKDGRQSRCRACNIEVNKQWYRDNPDARPRRMDDYAKDRRRANHQRVLARLLEHPCVDCGEDDPVVLDFDHRGDKVANVSAMLSRAWATIVAEIEKCDVRCANCHRRRTAERLGSFRYRATTAVDQAVEQLDD